MKFQTILAACMMASAAAFVPAGRMPVSKLTKSVAKPLVVMEAQAGGNATPATKALVCGMVGWYTFAKGTAVAAFLSGGAGLAVLAAGGI